ncbi:hypothetical protein ACFX1S_031104 [Malus domestica]
MAKRDEPVTLGFPGGFVEDDDGLLDLSVRGEEGSEALGGGVPAEAADEELALGGVGIGDVEDGVEDVDVVVEVVVIQIYLWLESNLRPLT